MTRDGESNTGACDGTSLRHAQRSLCVTVLSAPLPIRTLPVPCCPGTDGHSSFLTWVALTVHQFPNELLIDSAHLGTAATCSHCEVVKPCVLGDDRKHSDVIW